ncbi:hypothetical protein Tco_0651739 [Tanacetum coccineum]|uniref:Uncharacterized protein n=1 Tax=Tanacetum coccineum TaxID=301880 RepID=A0ABQ4WVU0_9ASTR
MSSECNNIKLAIQNDKSEVVCAICKQCLITYNHDVCVLNYVNDINSHVNKFNANVSNTAYQKKHKLKDSKPKKVGSKQRLDSPKPRKPRTCLRWSPTRRIFDLKGKIIESSESESQYDCSKDSGCSKHITGNLKLLINFILKFLGTVRFGNDHVAAILGYDCPSVKYLFVYELYVTNLSIIMSSITAQQTKLDLKLIPKEKRLKIGKCNRRINPGKKQREPTFQVVLDALALTLCYSAFLTTADVPKICPRVHGQNFDELPTKEDIVSFFKELGHTREIKTITNIVVYQMHHPWRTFATIINRSLSGKTTGLDKLHLSRTHIPWGIETPVISLSKKKEKMTVKKRKGIDLLFEVALTEEAQYEEVRKKSLRDFHKTHQSGSGTVTKLAPSAAKIKPSVTNKGTSAKPGVPDVTEEESTESSDQESDSGDDNTQSDNEKGSDSEHETDENETSFEPNQEENEEDVEDDEEEKDDELVKTPSNSTDDEDKTNVKDKDEGDEDKGMDYTTNQFDNDVNVRLNEPVNIDEGLIQKEGADAEMINVQQGNENLETTLNQVIEDAYVTLSTVTKKTEVPFTSSSHSSDLAFKFLNFSYIPHTNA